MIRSGGPLWGAKGESGSTREARRRPGRGFGGGDAPRGRRIAPKSTSAGGLQPVDGASPPPTAASAAGLARQAPAGVRRVRLGLASPSPEDLPGLRFGTLDLPDVRPGLAGGQDPEVSVSGRGASAAGEVVRRRLGVGAARPGRGRRRPGAGAGDGRAPSTTGEALTRRETGSGARGWPVRRFPGPGRCSGPELAGERYFADGLRELPDNRRLAVLAVCAVEWETFIADAVVETHDRIVGRTYREAARTCESQLGDETAAVREALRAFAALGTALLAQGVGDGGRWRGVYPERRRRSGCG